MTGEFPASGVFVRLENCRFFCENCYFFVNSGPLFVCVQVVIYSEEFGTLGFVEECRKYCGLGRKI